MKSKIKYTDEKMGKLKVIKDFIPSPDKLVLKEETGERAFMKAVVEGLMDLEKGREVPLGDVKKRFGLK